jgi:hypothetical protein
VLSIAKRAQGSITLVTMLAVFMLTVGSGLPYFGHTRYRTFMFDRPLCPTAPPRAQDLDKVFTESGLPRENVFRILPEQIRDYLFNSLRRFLMHECP